MRNYSMAMDQSDCRILGNNITLGESLNFPYIAYTLAGRVWKHVVRMERRLIMKIVHSREGMEMTLSSSVTFH